MGQRTYSPEFNLQVVLEALQSDGTDAEVAQAYDIHPVTLSGWKKKLKENGSKAFGGGQRARQVWLAIDQADKPFLLGGAAAHNPDRDGFVLGGMRRGRRGEVR